MSWLDGILVTLSKSPICGYLERGPAASEPTALAALALVGHGYREPAREAAGWLARLQGADGSVGVCEGQATPAWTTSLAMLAWAAVDEREHSSNLARAVAWTLKMKGHAIPPTKETLDQLGHDTTLVAWPWCEGTHSWLEPTAFFVLALQAAGEGKHARTREAVRLVLDRQLETGGCNYGNTVVLGQPLRAHVQPSGIALLALASEPDGGTKTARCVKYLRGALSARTTTASLCWAVLGLAAHGQAPLETSDWLAAAAGRTRGGDGSPCKLALLALAALEEQSPLVTLPLSKTTK